MFAVMKTGGKQYKVQSGDILRIEKIAADAGEKVQFNEVLMIGGDSPVLGTPLVSGAAVQAEVVEQVKGEKVIHFVKRRRKHGSQRRKGHRQHLTLLRVTEILASGGDKSGVKEAVGAGIAGWTGAASEPERYADNRAEQAEMKKRVATGGAKEKPVAPKKSEATAAPETEAAEAGAASKPANLLSEARGGQPDDLKQISGVGPALEKKLHANGVFHFDQIAAWTPAEIAYMDDQLSFKGRIDRDDWIGQAKTLAAEADKE